MENPTPRKGMSTGFWVGMGLAAFFSIVFVGMAAFVLSDFFRIKNIERVKAIEYSNTPMPDDRNTKYPEPIVDDETPVFTVVEQMPEFRGGDEARIKFLTNNIQYPREAKESGIQGTVYVTFVIAENGRVTDAKVLRGIGGGCDQEALRVVRLMPPWKPGKQAGKAVRVQFNMPIRFTLN
jgi:periplasmic protein TonB